MERNGYHRTSTAYDFGLFMPAQKREAKIVELPKPRMKKKRTSGRQSSESGLFVKRIGMFLTTGVILFMLCAMIYTRSEIACINDLVLANEKQLAVLQNEEIRLHMEIENKLSYTNLEQAAQEIGMVKKDMTKVHYLQWEENDRIIIREPATNHELTANP